MHTVSLPSRDWFERNGLNLVLAVAIVLRLLAVLFSKGFMASDDQFQTVTVAYRWIQHGLFNAQGHLTWPMVASSDISRFPLYTLFLYVLMSIYKAFGVMSLDTMMYGVRAAHAVLSLIGVWAVYRIVESAAQSARWAVIGGLIMAAHFAMPFLAVRNLIEMVGGTIWVWALYFLYQNRNLYSERSLFLAGVVSGLAWAIRFQVLFAFWVVPLVLVFQYKRLRPAVVYCAGLAAVIVAAGVFDWWLLGSFMASSVNHVAQGLREGAVYNTTVFIYPLVILGFFIPPASVVFFVPAFRKSFWARHQVLVVSTLAFIVIHSFVASRMERYMLPIVPSLILILVFSWKDLLAHRVPTGWWRKLAIGSAAFAAVANVICLVPLTVNYGHKGMVEPLVKASAMKDAPSVLFVSPEVSRFFPLVYGDQVNLTRRYAHSWGDMPKIVADSAFLATVDFLIVYPDDQKNLPRFVDSLTRYLGPIKPVFTVTPSPLDRLLHFLNPRHNHLEAAWIYTLDR